MKLFLFVNKNMVCLHITILIFRYCHPILLNSNSDIKFYYTLNPQKSYQQKRIKHCV